MAIESTRKYYPFIEYQREITEGYNFFSFGE